MRDIRIIQPESIEEEWNLDIDILNGQPAFLDKAAMTSDQRAGISVFVSKGAIPGMLDTGIQWSDYFQQGSSDGYIKITNQMNQMVQAFGSSPEDRESNKTYYPLALLDEEGGITVQVIRQ